MSIRALAVDLYRAKQKLDTMQQQHDNATFDDKQALARELTLVRKEYQMLRRMLDGEKDSGNFRKRFDGFGNSRS